MQSKKLLRLCSEMFQRTLRKGIIFSSFQVTGDGFDSHRPLQKSWVRSGKILYKTFRRDSLRLGPNKSGVELMAELVERVFQICPSIPKDIDATALTTAMVQTFVPPETPEPIRKQFAFNC